MYDGPSRRVAQRIKVLLVVADDVVVAECVFDRHPDRRMVRLGQAVEQGPVQHDISGFAVISGEKSG